jgi:hypothetical protein
MVWRRGGIRRFHGAGAGGRYHRTFNSYFVDGVIVVVAVDGHVDVGDVHGGGRESGVRYSGAARYSPLCRRSCMLDHFCPGGCLLVLCGGDNGDDHVLLHLDAALESTMKRKRGWSGWKVNILHR